MNDTSQTYLSSAKNFFYGTFLSRCSGLLRDISLAIFFGSHPQIAAFMVAYRFANLFRRLFGESTLQAGFVPHFEAIRMKDPRSASLFYRDVFFSMVVFLASLILIFELVLAKFSAGSIIYLIMIMLPGLLFICLYALNSSLLQCQKIYFLPAAAPVAFNLIWIIGIFLFYKQIPSHAVIGLAIAVVFAFFFQWLCTTVKTVRLLSEQLSLRDWLSPKIFSSDLKKIVKPISLGIVGIAAVQVNSALDTLFARIANASGPAYLWYAIRLQQLPLALFGIAISSALLPLLSRAIEGEDLSKYRKFMQLSFRHTVALLLTATLAIIALGGAGINLLYGRGGFDSHSVMQTLTCLWGYAVGLLPSALILLFATGFYAKKSYWIPAFSSICAVLLNIFLNSYFIFGLHWGAASVALATSLSAIFNCAFLSFFLSKRVRKIFDETVWRSFGKTFFCGLIAMIFTMLFGYWAFDDPTIQLLFGYTEFFRTSFSYQIISFLGQATLFFGVLILTAKIFMANDILELLKKSQRKTQQV